MTTTLHVGVGPALSALRIWFHDARIASLRAFESSALAVRTRAVSWAAPMVSRVGARVHRGRGTLQLWTACLRSAEGVSFVVVQIPWEHFRLPLGPATYAATVMRKRVIPVVVARAQDGRWHCTTTAQSEWLRASARIPLESLAWNPTNVKVRQFPWERFDS